MAIVGKVVALTGTAYIITDNGDKRPLQLGDTVETSDTIQTVAGAEVELDMTSGRAMRIGPEQLVAFTPELTNALGVDALDSEVNLATIETVIKAIESGKDINAVLEETAAGSGSRVERGFDFVNLMRIIDPLNQFGFNYDFDFRANIDDQPITGRIIDDDANRLGGAGGGTPIGPLNLQINDVTRNEAAGTITFTVSLTRSSASPVTVDYVAVSDSATVGVGLGVDAVAADPLSGTLTFAPGQLTQTITFNINNDLVFEGVERFNINLSNPTGGALIIDNQGIGTIRDDGTGDGGTDNDFPSLSISGLTNVNEGIGTITYTVTLSNPSSQTVTVNYATAGGTATSGSDFTATTGTLTFAPGQTTQTFTVAISEDTVFEGPEAFTVNLSAPTNATIATGSVSTTIQDDGTGTIDDPLNPAPPPPATNDVPQVTAVSSPTVTEGGNLNYTVTLSNASTTPTIVTLTPASGTGTLGTDTTTPIQVSFDGGTTFVNVTGPTVSVPANTTSFITRIPTFDDTIGEGGETILLNASTPRNVGPVTGTGTITDNDTPNITIDDVTRNEGAGTITFTVSLTIPSSNTVTVDYAAVSVSATVGTDITAGTSPLSGTVTFAPNQLTQTITLNITDDTVFEGSESFNINLSNPTGGALIGDAQGIGTILDDGTGGGGTTNDVPQVTAVSSPTVTEGGNLNYTVTLSNASTTPTIVTLTPASGTGTLGTDTTTPIQVSFDGGTTFVNVTGPTVSVPANTTSFITRIPTFDDTISELSETILLSASTPRNVAPVQGTGTITDNDGTPTLSISGLTNVNEGIGTITYTVTLSNPSSQTVTVNYATAGGTATSGSDFTATTGTLTFAPGQTTQTFTVAISEDTVFEGPEAFTVNLSAPTNATIATGSVSTTIQDDGTGTIDDPLNPAPPPPATNDVPQVTAVSSPTVTEGGNLNYTVTLSNASTTPTIVTLTPASGTGTLGTDTTTPIQVSFDGGTTFVNVTGPTVSVPANTTSFITRIPTFDDTISELSETILLSASTPRNVAPVQGTGTITDNDGTPTLSISGLTNVNEGIGTITYTVTLSNPSSQTVTVNYATAGGTATSGSDFTATTGTLTFAPGQTTQTFTVAISEDTVFEGPEAFTVNLSAPTNATIATGSVSTTIQDDGTGTIDDPLNPAPPPPATNDVPQVTAVSSPTVTEGGNLNYTVTLSNASTTPTIVTLTPASGTGTLGTDTTTPIQVSFDGGTTFVNVTGPTVSVPANTTSFITRIPTFDDTIGEGGETILLNASTPRNVGPVTGTGTITDNDTPNITIDDVTRNEGAGTITFTVSLTIPSSNTVTVDYAAVSVSATVGTDITAGTSPLSGTVTFAPNQLTQTITLNITDDTVFEGSESFNINLSNPTGGALIGDAQGIGTILDDGTGGGGTTNDVPQVTAVSSPTVTEGGNLNYTVTLSNASTTPTIVTLTPASGTGTLGTDTTTPIQVSFDGGTTFVNVTGPTVSVPANTTSFITRIPTFDDTISELSETILLSASTPRNVAPVQGTGTITDNDGTPTLSISGLTNVNEGIGTITYTVTLSNPSSQTVTVNYATAGGTATSGSDFTATTGTLTFAPGQTTQTFTVAISEDTVFEGPEAFTVNLSAPTNATIATGSVSTTIQDDGTGTIDDPLNPAPPPPATNDVPQVTAVSSPTVTEGGNLNYTVTLSNASTTPTIVTLTPASGTGTLGTDTTTPIQVSFDGGTTFVNVTGPTVSVPANTTSFITRIPTFDDTISELSETILLSASTPRNVAPVQGTGTITDNDGTPTLSISGLTNVNEGIGTITYTVTLSNPSSQTVTVNYATAGGTATSGSDFTATTGTLTFAPGQTTQTFTVAISEDTVFEGPEAFTVNLSAPTNATIATGSVSTTIQDDGTGTIDDPLNPAPPPPATNDVPQVTAVSSPTVTEGGNLNYTVTLSNASTTPTIVTLTPASGTGTLGTDTTTPIQVSFDGGTTFVNVTGPTVSVPANTTSFITRIPTFDDTISELSETILLSASTPRNVAPVQGTGTITDNDGTPTLSISGLTNVNEGIGTITYTVTLSNPSSQTVTVNYATAGGTATSGSDFTATTGTLTFAPGQTTQTFTVAISEDTVFEGPEAFTVNLSAPTNATIATGSVSTTIQDDGTGTIDDPLNPAPPPPATNDVPQVTAVSSPTVTEGGNLNYTVTLSNASTTPTIVTLTPASGTGTLGTDTTTPIQVSFDGGTTFVNVTGPTVSVPANTTSFITRIPTFDDTISELSETILLSASTPRNVAPVQGTGTITDNDGTPTLSISGLTNVNEGIGTITYTVTLSNPSSQTVTVNYATAGGTATSGSDFTATTGTLTFAPGQTTQTFTVAISEDTVFEGPEAFTVNLSAPTNATIATGSVSTTIQDDGTGTIDDPLNPAPPPPATNDVPQVTAVSSPTVTEGGNLNYTVTLSNASTTPTIVTLTPASGTGTLGTDTTTPIQVSFDGGTTFVNVTGPTVSVPANTTSFITRIPTFDDTISELSETILLSASTPRNVAPVQGTGTITDNDGTPTLSISGLTNVNEGIGTITYTVTLSNPSSQTVTVNYATAGGTATSGSDFTATTGTLTFAPGQTTQTFTVAISEDTVFEGPEAFTVNLSAPTNATIATGSVSTTIQDDGTGTIDDPLNPAPPPPATNDVPQVTAVSSPTVTEGGNLNYTVTLSNASTTPTIVTLTPASGTGTLGTDTTTPIQVSFDGGTTFVNVTGPTVSVPANTTSFITRIPTFDDTISELSETILLSASTPRNVAPVQGTGTITDNDGTPTLSISGLTNVNEGIGTITYTVTLSNPSSQTVTVNYATAGGTATSGSDFTATTGTLTFAPGQTTQTFTVAISEDTVFEGPEAFTVNLSAPTNATIATGSVSTTIQDDGTGTIDDPLNPAPPPPATNDVPQVTAVSSPTVTEGGNLNYTVTLSNASTTPTIVTLTPASGTGTLGTDTTTPIQVSFDGGTTFVNVTGPTVSVPANTTSFITRIPTFDDTISELSETILLSASTPRNVAPVQGTGTITDNDGTPTLSISGLTNVNEGIGTITYTVTLSNPSSQTVTVNYATAGGTATSGSDFTATTGTLTFAPGQTTQTFTVAISEDTVFEGPEAFTVNLSAPTNATIATGSVSTTIQDDGTGTIDDPLNPAPPPPATNDVPQVTAVSSPTVTEGGNLNYTVTLSNASTTPTIVTLTPASGTGTLGTDTTTPIQVSFDGGTTFVNVTGPTVSVPANTTSFITRIPTFDDTISELSETILLSASTPRNVAPVQGTGTITDNDGTPTLSISGLTNVNEGIGTITYTVTLSNPSSQTVTVNYATAGGTATSGSDFTATTGTLTFAPGQTTQTFTVAISEDTVFEGPEAFTVNLSAPTNATIATGSVSTTIQDDGTGTIDDPLNPAPPPPATNDVPQVTAVSSPTVTEGGNLNYTVTLSNASTTPTIVTLTPASGTGTLGTDTTTPIQVSFDGGTTFVNVTGPTVSVPANTTSFITRIPTFDDTISELSETILLSASTPRNVAPVQGTGTITDNDGTPTLSISGLTNVNEGIGTITYTVTLSNPSSQTVTVNYATAGGTATSGSDFTATTGTLTFAPGQTTQTFTVAISEDTVFEGPEAFTVNLSAPTNATIATGSVSTTIQDDGTGTIDDPLNPAPPPPATNDVPQVTAVSSPTVTEGGNLNYTVTLSNASTTPTIVTLTPASGTGTLGTDTTTPIQVSFDGGTTFVNVTGPTVSVPANTTSFITRIPTFDDTISELSETILLSASTPRNVAPVQGTGTITDNDGTPTLSISGLTNVNEGIGTITYTVTLSNPSSQTVTVNYATAGGTATSGSDFTATTGTLTFAPGQTTQTFTVAISEDTVFEGPEAFTVNLSAPTNATIATGSVSTTIQDDGTGTIDDPLNPAPPPPATNDVPQVTAVSSPTVTEGGNLNYTVTLSNASTTPTIVTLTPASGTGTLGTDTTTPIQVSFDGGTTFVNVTGPTVSVPANTTSFITRIPTFDDAIAEGNETILLNASTPRNTLPITGTGTIIDNEPTIDLDGNNSSGATGSGYTTTFSENGSAVSIADTDIVIASPVSLTMASATITLTNAQAGDVLAAVSGGGITASVVGNVVTLTGTATLAQYQTAIQAITFTNTTDTPNTTPRNITVVLSDGVNTTNTAVATVNVVAVNDTPTIAPVASIAVTEDVATKLNGLSFGDIDAGTGNVTITLSVPAGTLTATSGAGVTVGGTATSLTLTGTLAAINTFVSTGTGVFYTTALNANGTVNLSVNINDNGNTGIDPGLTGTATNEQANLTIPLNITPVNDAPIAVQNNYTMAEDGAAITLTPLTGDSDPDGTTPTIQSINSVTLTGGAQSIPVTGGTVNISAGGVITFTPAANFNGTVTFPYVITDGALTSTANQVITVTPVNDAPIAVQNNYTMAEDGAAITLTPLTGDSDPDGTTPTIQSINSVTLTGGAQSIPVTGGTVNISAGGVITFTPAANFNGTVTFPYVITDGALTSTANQVITVTPVNDAPIAVQNNYTMAEDGAAITLTPLTGDSDPDGTTPTIQSINSVTLTGGAQSIPVTGGTVNISAGGVITFTPAANFNGTVTFPYVITDGALTSTANQVITVNAVNDTPTIAPVASIAVTEDVATKLNGLSFGDIDAGTGNVTITLSVPAGTLTATSGAGVTVGGTATSLTLTGTLAAINTFVSTGTGVFYTTALNANGTVNLSVNINDNGNTGIDPGLTGTATNEQANLTIPLNITPVNDAPIAVVDNYTSVEGTTTLKTTVLVNDTDPEGTPLTVGTFATTTSGVGALVANGTNTITTALGGTVVMNANGTYTYTAPARDHSDLVGDVDTFAYRATDGSLNSGWTTVSITLTDTGPVANNDIDSVGIGSTVAGNVITGTGGVVADTLNVDTPHSLTNVTLTTGTQTSNTLDVPTNVRTIVTNRGTLVIDQDDGSYTYTASITPITVTNPTGTASFTSVGVGLFGFEGTSPFTGANLNLAQLTGANGTTNAGRVRFNAGAGNGVGVDDTAGGGNTSDSIQNGEELVINLGVTSRSVSINLTDLGTGEQAIWQTFNAAGTLISSGTTAGVASGVTNINISTGTPISYVLVRSTAAASVFKVDGITIIPEPSGASDVFTYTLRDGDGSTSNATLTMNYDTSTTASNDLAAVFESGINTNGAQSGGTQEAQTVERAVGNILGNDTGVTSFSNLTITGGAITGGTVVASAPDVNGVVTVTVTDTTAAARTIATITVYTQNFGANVKGDYVVDLVGRTTDGTGTNDSFTMNYTLTNSVSGEVDNATLTVDVVDDVPTVQDAIVQVQQGVLPRQNLVFVIDSSGSMAGEVKNVAANGTVTIQNRLQATIQAVTAVINEYFSQGGDVRITLIDFDDAARNRGTFTTAASAIAALTTPANFVVGGGTNYDAALTTAQAAMTPPVVGERYTTYFISDGVPTVGDTTDPAANGYRAFATANNVTTYAIGIASDISNPTELNNIHNVDSDNSGVRDNAIIVTNVATLDDVLLASVPTTFGGSVAGSTANSSLNFGADGGYISQLIMRLDTNGDNIPDADVTFNFNPTTGVITLVGGGAPQTGFPLTSDTVTLNNANGFEDGILIFNFRTGEYVYQTAGFATEGEQFDIKFTATDGDGDTASGKQTVQIVDGKPDANNDIDTLRGGQTFFEGNVISAIGTDGGDSVALTSFSTNRSGEDNPGDGGDVSSIVFKGITFDLTTLVTTSTAVATSIPGSYTVTDINGVRTLTWTATAGGAALVFNEDGYYRYTPPTAEISNNVTGALTTYNLDTAGNITTAATAGLTLTAIARASATEGSATVNPIGGDGTGVTGGGNNNNQIDDLESLVITFNTALHPRGVQGVVLNVDAGNSNLGGTNAFNYNVFDVHGELIGQFASNAEGNVIIPFQGIGKIVVDSGTIDTSSYPGAAGSIFSVAFQTILATGGTPAPAPEVINYTIRDADGDTSSASLTLNNIIDDFAGTAANNTITGTARNENISGLAGDDTINAGAGFDIVRGGDGNDIIDGGADDDQLYGNAGNDTVSGGTGNDQIYGDAGNDTLNGNDGNDFISGGDGVDTINGGIGTDIIIGGTGNDILTGGTGADIFRWELADRGTTSSPTTDVITDFDPAAVGGDVLDVRDLLTGEQHVTGTGNLTSYLHFELVGANTIVHISNNGAYSNGYSPTKDVQRITLTGVDLVTGFADDQAIIQNLLNNNKLITD